MRPTGNAQGNYYYFSLSTGRIINRTNATALPMPDDVIDRVQKIARRQKANRGLIYADRNQIVNENDDDESDDDSSYHQDMDIESDDDDESDAEDEPDHGDDSDADDSDYDPQTQDIYEEESESSDDEPDTGPSIDAPENPGVDEEIEALNNVPENPGVNKENEALENAPENPGVALEIAPENTEASDEENEALENAPENPGVNGQQAEPGPNDDEIEEQMDEQYGARTREGLRSRRERNFGHLFATVEEKDPDSPVSPATGAHLATPQMSMKRGLKMFGNDGVAAVKKEMLQLHDRKVMIAKKSVDLTRDQKREALEYLMFLKRKRNGKVKGRGCADGRKQRAYIPREDATSPTAATMSVMLTAVIDALEDREVAIVDVPGAFMQADMDELVHVRFTGKMVDLLLEIDPEMYGPCVVIDKGEKVLYVELLKALYGTLRAARLFWEKLSNKLKEWGFKINDYDPCVANKIVNDKQITVVWHVDDLKISHVQTKVVDEFIEQMEDEFGKEEPLSQSRGKIHEYLGMTLDFSNPGEVQVQMLDFVEMVLTDLPKEFTGRVATPAANHLFKVNEKNPVLLDDTKRELFVKLVMQLLYLSQRARPDLRTAISFLCGRLQTPDVDDNKKLGRVLKYLQSTKDLSLILSADGSGLLRWWVDASFGVHMDMKGHTGGNMSMGKGSVFTTANKQKLVTRSSTECEVVGVHEVMPQLLWTTQFLQEQGFDINDTILYQDNMSSILLEKNGRSSSSKRTRHMNIRYFFVKDRVASKELSIEHCPTEDMVADYFTKALQGRLFYKLRDLVMNIGPSSKYSSAQRSVLRNGETRKSDTDPSRKEMDVADMPRTYRDALVGGE
jgi:hypothetical protein